jgi:hypothetical protein
MEWSEAVERGMRQCALCWAWRPIADLERHDLTWGAPVEGQRKSCWWSCRRPCRQIGKHAK